MIRLRPAMMADAKLLLDWRNDPDVIAASTSQRAVTESEHAHWITDILQNPHVHLSIAELNMLDGTPQPIGMGRIDLDTSWLLDTCPIATLSYSIAKTLRGQGYGTALVRRLVEDAKRLGAQTIRVRIRHTNLPSLICAAVSGVNSITLL